MGLLNNSSATEQSNKVFTVSDCVGKSGYCEYVTDPRTQKLYQNIVLFSEEKKEELEEALKETFKDEIEEQEFPTIKMEKPTSPERPQTEKEVLTNEMIAQTLIEIIKGLEKIAHLLKERD